MAYWQLIRQDDNGNQAVMAEFDSREDAEREMGYYQGKGHKQTYWVMRKTDG